MNDFKSVLQGWSDCEVPVLWSRWFPFTFSTKPYAGAQLLQEVFVHMPGAVDVKTGKEPLFAWVRMTVAEVCDGFVLDEQFKLRVRIAGYYGASVYADVFVLRDLKRSLRVPDLVKPSV